jgi:beta-mannosidase
LPIDAVVELARVPVSALGPQELLGFAFTSPEGPGCEIFAPRAWKTYDLQASNPSLQVVDENGTWRLQISATALSLFATVDADVPGRFSTNARLVTPTMPLDLTFTPDEPGATPQFTVRDLYTATYGRA